MPYERDTLMEATNKKVLFIDNFDSFTYNLVDDFGEASVPDHRSIAPTPAVEDQLKRHRRSNSRRTCW